MSEMSELIIESTSKVFAAYSTKEVVNEAEKGIWANELWNKLAQYGIVTVAVPEDLGGSGGDYEDALSIVRLAGRFLAPVPLAETFIANWLLAEHGVAVTNEVLTIATETDGQPFKFYQEGNGWIVTGRAKNVPWGRFAKKLVVLGEASEGGALSVLNLEKAEIIQGNNLAGEARDQVVFNQVFIPECTIIPVDKIKYEERILYSCALTKSVMMAGALDNILEIAINYSKERSQFGRPIHRFQAIQHHLALLAGEAAAAGIAASYAIHSFQKNPVSKEIALAKLRINEAAGKAAPIAHQVLAAIGFTYEHILHHNTRRLWAWRDEFGTESDWEKVITKQLQKLEKNELWPLITGVKNNQKKVETR